IVSKVLLVCFGLLGLGMFLVVVAAVAVSLGAIVYRLIPGPNVPFNYNRRNMLVRWRNTLVTAAAFTVVIRLVVVMLTFVNSLLRLTEGSARPGNVVILQDGALDEAFSNLPAEADVRRLPEVVRKDILKDAKGNYLATKEVYVIVNQPIPNAP